MRSLSLLIFVLFTVIIQASAQTCVLSGTTTTNKGRPAKCFITITDGGSHNYQALSDKHGNYCFSQVAPGAYQLNVLPNDYDFREVRNKDVVISDNKQARLDVRLEKKIQPRKVK